MRTIAISLALVPALVLGQTDLGLGSPATFTTLTRLAGTVPSISAIPSVTETDVLPRREETSPCPTTTAAVGLLDILRRDDAAAVADEGSVPMRTETLPTSGVVDKVDSLTSSAKVKRDLIFKKADSPTSLPLPTLGDRDLGLPSLPAVLGNSTSSEAASTTFKAADSKVTPVANRTVSSHNATVAGNLTSTFTSYPSPEVTKTDFRFDSAAVNGPSPTSASSVTATSQTVAARQVNSTESTTSKNSTSGLDLNSKYVCSANITTEVTNSTSSANTTASGTAAMSTGTPRNATTAVHTAYYCYERSRNATHSATQKATGTTFMTLTTKPSNVTLSDAAISESITDTFSVTSMAVEPSTVAATTTSADAVNALVSGVASAIPS